MEALEEVDDEEVEQYDPIRALGNWALAEQAATFFTDTFLSSSFGLSPTEALTQAPQKLAASELMLETGGGGGHFRSFSPQQEHLHWLKDVILNLFQGLDGGRQLMAHIGTCTGAMLTKVASLVGGDNSPNIASEAGLRYAIGDPLLDMLLQTWGYQVTECFVNVAKVTVLFPFRLCLRSK